MPLHFSPVPLVTTFMRKSTGDAPAAAVAICPLSTSGDWLARTTCGNRTRVPRGGPLSRSCLFVQEPWFGERGDIGVHTLELTACADRRPCGLEGS